MLFLKDVMSATNIGAFAKSDRNKRRCFIAVAAALTNDMSQSLQKLYGQLMPPKLH